MRSRFASASLLLAALLTLAGCSDGDVPGPATEPEGDGLPESCNPLRTPGVQRFIASSELGSGMMSNPVVPEDAARALRDA